jgi:hypothetical protein
MLRRALRALPLPGALLLPLLLGAGSARATIIPAGATDQTSSSSATINFPTTQPQGDYTPSLLAVGRSGQGPASVGWAGKFTFHPLRFDNLAISGNSADQPMGMPFVKDLRSGRYAFYCGIHGGPNGQGMSGVVYVAGPRAALQAEPEDVAPGGSTTLNASATDLVEFGASTATYEFDPEGDGTFLPPTTSSSIQATYPTAGTYSAVVRVTDNGGRVDEIRNNVYVANPLGPPPPVDPLPGTGGPPPGQKQTKPPAKAATFADLTKLPSRRRCVNRRRGLRVEVHDATGGDVRFARVKVNGRPARRVTVGKRRVITVHGLRGTSDVLVTVWLSTGRIVSKSFRYRVCGS